MSFSANSLASEPASAPAFSPAGPSTSDEDAATAAAHECGMEQVELGGVDIAPNVLACVARAFAVRHGLVPLRREGGTLTVAVADPLAIEGVDWLAHRLKLEIEPVFAPWAQITAAIERHYGSPQRALADLLKAPAVSVDGGPVGSRVAVTEKGDAPIIQWVNELIREAVRRRASDIHFEPLERRFRVRYRIDGVLVEVENPPKALQLAIVSRLKIMANISIAEKRVPQDGRIQLTVDRRALDLRVSSLPTAHGESIVMRLLDQQRLQLGLAELGCAPEDQVALERLIGLPDGLVLVTGPTGSGKTTTLYSCLEQINRPDRKIITVEDPVEYQLAGINQVPVRTEIGMTFASALRAMLRQAPNVIMIGEIRDLETAEIALHAALTGHLVLSTLHTNDAPGAVARLVDIGVKPFLVATALRAVVAQRLVRKTCETCRRPRPAEPGARGATEKRGEAIAPGERRRGSSCPACDGRGYLGRTGLFEIMPVDAGLQQLIHEGAGAARLRARARANGMRTLRDDGLRQVSAGLTTMEEVVSITVGDASLSPVPHATVPP